MELRETWRNKNALTEREISRCLLGWTELKGDRVCPLDVSEACENGSKTRFIEDRNLVALGSDVMPGMGLAARDRMSMLACLAHELAHAERFAKKYRRPTEQPDMLIDEAETSLDASFNAVLSLRDRKDLVEDAGDQIAAWLGIMNS